MKIQIKRVYDASSPRDGKRVLVDRLWPRGVKKEDAHIDQWLKEIAPSQALRKWFGHDVARWNEFRNRYRAELEANRDALAALQAMADKHTLTLVFSAKDEEHNNAVVLKEYLARK